MALASTDANTILHGDCIDGMNQIQAESVDLVFADPPFNIGYEYDVYHDRRECAHYLEWSQEWIQAVHRVLKRNGTFWLAIGDEYAAELKVASQEIGFHCRSWVIWYYTFGVNCSKKFSRSHAHLFYFVKDPDDFTFREQDLANRVPSARQLVYNDKRAHSKGRLPDDTWIIRPASVVGELCSDSEWELDQLTAPQDDTQTWTLRPQDLSDCFQADEDTWYFPRVAGTFKERAGFHGCQMPEQLLGRIIRSCSEEGDFVLDPFSGSATTLAVAKKLGRQFLGFDMSEQYVQHGLARLESIRLGDRLDGSPEPLVSAPSTKGGRKSSGKGDAVQRDLFESTRRFQAEQAALTLRGIMEAFRITHDGFSADRLVADPDLNQAFLDTCDRLGIVGSPRTWNILLFRLRKSGQLQDIAATRRTSVSWLDCDAYLPGSEIALESVLAAGAESLDEILCDPEWAVRFDELADSFAPGYRPFEYRWAALKLRKQAKTARNRAALLDPPARMSAAVPVSKVDWDQLTEVGGIYAISQVGSKSKLYVGETLDLRARLTAQFGQAEIPPGWREQFGSLQVQWWPTGIRGSDMLAWQCRFVQKFKPRLNYRELLSQP